MKIWSVQLIQCIDTERILPLDLHVASSEFSLIIYIYSKYVDLNSILLAAGRLKAAFG